MDRRINALNTQRVIGGDGATTGYLHPAYAESFSRIGIPHRLPRSRGMILVRPVGGSPWFDAMGCYPLFTCLDWSRLPEDLEALEGGLVSLTLVADPFGAYDGALLERCFPDMLRPYKEHHVVDLRQGPSVSRHHARNVRRALEQVEVERCENPRRFAREWVGLYGCLVRRHGIRGVAAFSADSLSRQLEVPGLVMFRAVHRGGTVGIALWVVQGQVGTYHLAAYSDLGYHLRASFALFDCAIASFAPHLLWLNLGAGAGIHSAGEDGLIRFKKGWATGTRTAFLCGRILHRARYEELAARRGMCGNDYFPIYRKGDHP